MNVGRSSRPSRDSAASCSAAVAVPGVARSMPQDVGPERGSVRVAHVERTPGRRPAVSRTCQPGSQQRRLPKPGGPRPTKGRIPTQRKQFVEPGAANGPGADSWQEQLGLHRSVWHGLLLPGQPGGSGGVYCSTPPAAPRSMRSPGPGMPAPPLGRRRCSRTRAEPGCRTQLPLPRRGPSPGRRGTHHCSPGCRPFHACRHRAIPPRLPAVSNTGFRAPVRRRLFGASTGTTPWSSAMESQV